MATFFRGMEEDETLEKFLDRHVRPNTAFLENCGSIIDTVVRLVHKCPMYSIKEVIKGGSLGKGTGVREHSDVDLLVVLNNFDSVTHLKDNMKVILKNFEDYLLTSVNDDSDDEEENDLQLRILGTTPFTLQFGLKCTLTGSRWFDVDLLPIIDVWSAWSVPDFLGGQTAGLRETYSKMENEASLRKYYAKSLAKIQVQFVKPMPARVKDLIRLLKYWKYTEEVDLTSYCIELLVIFVWRNQGRPESFKLKPMMTEVVNLLRNFERTSVSFNDHYDPDKFLYLLNKRAPYVLDPANPFHDVSSDSKWSWLNFRKDYSRIESKGRELQRKLQNLPEENSSTSILPVAAVGLGMVLGFAAKKLVEILDTDNTTPSADNPETRRGCQGAKNDSRGAYYDRFN